MRVEFFGYILTLGHLFYEPKNRSCDAGEIAVRLAAGQQISISQLVILFDILPMSLSRYSDFNLFLIGQDQAGDEISVSSRQVPPVCSKNDFIAASSKFKPSIFLQYTVPIAVTASFQSHRCGGSSVRRERRFGIAMVRQDSEGASSSSPSSSFCVMSLMRCVRSSAVDLR